MKKSFLPFLLICSLCMSHTCHAQQQAERLIAMARYYSQADSFAHYDSTIYIYSGLRSVVDTNWEVQLAFDTSYNWRYYPGGYALYQRQVQTWDTSLIHPLTDTVWNFDTASASYQYYTYTTYAQPSADSPFTELTMHWTSPSTWSNWQSGIRTFNAAHNITREVYFGWDTTRWDTASVYTVIWDSLNRYADGDYRNPGVSPPTPKEINELYSYDSLGRIDTILQQSRVYDSLPFTNQVLEIYTYDSTGIPYDLAYYPDTSGWILSYRHLETFDSRHNLTLSMTQMADTGGTWLNFTRDVYTYDTLSNYASIEQDRWYSGAWEPEGSLFHYYYQLYTIPADTTTTDSTTGIANITPTGDAHIYPVPASEMLSVDVTWPEAQASTATICDADGRKYGTFLLPNTASYHGYIPLAGLAPGAYTLQIRGGQGANITKVFNLVK